MFDVYSINYFLAPLTEIIEDPLRLLLHQLPCVECHCSLEISQLEVFVTLLQPAKLSIQQHQLKG